MGVGFDILEHCKKARTDHGPPYKCPLDKCDRSYKTVCGLQYHLKSYNHDNPTPQTPSTPVTPKTKKGRKNPKSLAIPAIAQDLEPLTFEEAQKMVQFEVNGVVCRWSINDLLEVTSKEKTPEGSRTEDETKIKVDESTLQPLESTVELPKANYKELEDYNICDAPPRPNAYIRFIEKSTEELDGEVEYDVDEEDTAWLAIMNERRETQGLAPVSVDSLELLMDRLEKESYFQAAVNGHSSGAVVDEDAVCCICMDGECQNTNVILFCDMCNLAVHQDCYGVPYIPEGQWLCRRCLQSPSRSVDCVLCPNQGGAFKQTDRGTWAHVVCALWIPEVRFANTVFLEPIDSIETIPAARWRLTCYVCKQKAVGACIQCHRNSCYAAFHVTCAQQAGLYMRMDAVKGGEVAGQPVLIQKIAFCDVHAPNESHTEKGDQKKEDARKKMIQARKVLAKKRTSAPIILIPTIPPERIQEIASLVTITKKSQFIQRLIAYWTLKRQFRNGVPLLRRLQSAQGGTRDSNTSNVDTIELCRQLKYWQCLRQDLERARLLCELVRKREKMKLEYTRICEKILLVKLKPLEASLRKILDLIGAKDTNEIFTEPVDLEEVPDYTTVVTEPMDLSTMKQKLTDGLYPDLASMEKDFNLMISNCLAYNNKDTVFYKAGIKMRDQCGTIFRQAKKELESAGLLKVEKEAKKPQLLGSEEALVSDIDKELDNLQGKSGSEVIAKLEDLLVRSQSLKHGLARAKRVKAVRSELNKAKRNAKSSNDGGQDKTETESQPTESQESEVEHTTDALSQTNSEAEDPDGNTTISNLNPEAPTGVSRRSTFLFAKKNQVSAAKEEGKEKIDSEISAGTSPYRKKSKAGKRSRTAGTVHTTMDLTNLTKDSGVPDSFKIYRAGKQTTDDERSDSDNSLSTCYSHDPSEISSDEDSDTAVESGIEKVLQPLQLVWAKCRGYPWYPALIIDPEMPKDFVYKGVPLPTPPREVLDLSAKATEHVYLVLFFDAKRTWQWLPAEKLELMGTNTEKDEAKANEPRKQSDRKAVKKAYENALNYIQQISDANDEECKEVS